MTVNPAALILLVVGFVALVVGAKGTQGKVSQLITGRADAGSTAAGGPHPTERNPMGSAPHLAADGSMGPVGPLGP